MSFEKQLNKRISKHNIRNAAFFKWWRKNDYKVYRVIFFPIYIIQLIREKCHKHTYDKLQFSNEKSKKLIDKELSRLVAYDIDCGLISKDEEIAICTSNDFGISFSSFGVWYRGQNKSAKNYFLKFSSEIKEFIINEYAIDGYQKMVIDDWIKWDKAKEKFGWYSTPNNKDYAIGVIFYKEKESKDE